MPTVAVSSPLTRLAEDVRAAAYLLEESDALRPYLTMLSSLPAEPCAWLEVLSPWVDDARHGLGPAVDERARVAAVGALGVVGHRAARELHDEPRLAAALRAFARWCFHQVRPGAA